MHYVVAQERMPALSVDQMTDAQRQAVAEISAGPRGAVKGPFFAMLRSPKLMNTVQKVGAYVRFECPLDKRINEMAALMGARA